MELYYIPQDHTLSSRNKSCSQGIKRMKKNREVDVILYSIVDWGFAGVLKPHCLLDGLLNMTKAIVVLTPNF